MNVTTASSLAPSGAPYLGTGGSFLQSSLGSSVSAKQGERNLGQPGKGPLKVLLADDHPVVLKGLRSLLEGKEDLLVVGEALDGEEAVRKAFESAWLTIPDAQWCNPRIWVKGDQGVMESTFTGTAADGARIEANMVDLLVFRDGKILRKNAFRKQRPPIAARA